MPELGAESDTLPKQEFTPAQEAAQVLAESLTTGETEYRAYVDQLVAEIIAINKASQRGSEVSEEDQLGYRAGAIVRPLKELIPNLNPGTFVSDLIFSYERQAGEQTPDWRMWAIFIAIPHEKDLGLTLALARR